MNNWRVNLPWPKEITSEDDMPDIEYLYENDEGVTKSNFDNGKALAAMLLADVVFLNSNWREDDWPDSAKKTAAVCVNTHDVFAWACADAETINYNQIEEVYRYFAKDQAWGTTVWAMIKNRQMPQKPVDDSIRKAGKWDLDSLQKEHNLRTNHYDGICHVLAKRKYDIYCGWCESIGRAPLQFDAGWWKGWDEYRSAHPGWYDDTWKSEDTRLCSEWRKTNGYETVSERA